MVLGWSGWWLEVVVFQLVGLLVIKGYWVGVLDIVQVQYLIDFVQMVYVVIVVDYYVQVVGIVVDQVIVFFVEENDGGGVEQCVGRIEIVGQGFGVILGEVGYVVIVLMLFFIVVFVGYVFWVELVEGEGFFGGQCFECGYDVLLVVVVGK